MATVSLDLTMPKGTAKMNWMPIAGSAQQSVARRSRGGIEQDRDEQTHGDHH